eukprot:TRINITY_DN30104_c0_g1_i1.p1 TRINITY_DN30104_c0_g1~~TRINITY_DN30104_c0_g1_i1.p1  ORF type:complete len:157 (-),score=43.88 TRINITY_DN30104_c0_g1_i1:108-527(-)
MGINMLQKVIYYDELSALVNKDLKSNKKLPRVLVVDVRNPGEIVKHGKIMNSINLPLKALDNILSMSEEDFFSEVGIKKGELGSCLLVTHCRSGPRGFTAAHILLEHGYTRFRIYSGSLLDWVANGGHVEKDIEENTRL